MFSLSKHNYQCGCLQSFDSLKRELKKKSLEYFKIKKLKIVTTVNSYPVLKVIV